MRSVLVTAVLALLAGAIATYVAIERGWLPARPGSVAIGHVPKMSIAEAEAHRENQYTAIQSIEDILALPGHFAQTEALYAIAGRSDSAGVQNLLFQASGIADPSDRKDMLLVLFSRLAELDAASALALSRTANFLPDRDFESEVWRTWGRFDLDAAIRSAAKSDSASRRNLAAQALFAAYDYWGNDTTEYIAESLGVKPDSGTRSLHLSRLADEDPAAAVAYINSLDSLLDRRNAASTLGHHLGRRDPELAAGFGALFNDAQLRSVYGNAVTHSAAQIEPVATLEALLQGGTTFEQMSQLATAFEALAAQDIDKALTYLERVDNRNQQRAIAGAIARQLAREDPERALAWARENDQTMYGTLYTQVLWAMAETQPARAIAEANEMTDFQQRMMAFNAIAMAISERYPEQAVGMLDQIKRPADRRNVQQSIASSWIQTDSDAALSWILAMEPSDRDDLLAEAAHWVARMDLDTAMQYLPRLDEKDATVWREQIAANLAAQRSIAEAQSFIAQFEGSDDYPRLYSSLLSGLARTDAPAAIRMVAQMPAGAERDSFYTWLLMNYANQEPEQAAASLALIGDENERSNATNQVVSQWSRSDPAAAERWTENLPRGKQRDNAIMALTSRWEEITPARRLLINSIGNAEIRKQTAMGAIYRIARLDLEKAESLLLEFDLSDDERQDIRNTMQKFRYHRRDSYLQMH